MKYQQKDKKHWISLNLKGSNMTSLFSIQKLLTAASVFFTVLASTPLFFIGYSIVNVSLGTLPDLFSYYAVPFFTTVGLSTFSGLAVLVLAVITVYAVLLLPVSYRKLVSFVLVFPILFPPYIAAISYIAIFKSTWGLSLMGRSSLIEFWQAAGVLSLFLYPYSFLLIKNRIEMIDPAHLKIASLYKWSFFDTLRYIYFPHVKHALLSAFLIPFLYVASDFGAVSILRMDTLTTELYQSMVRRFDNAEGAVLSVALLVVSAVTLVSGSRFASGIVSSTRKNDNEIISHHVNRRSMLFSVCWILSLIALTVAVPLTMLIKWFFQFMKEESVLKNIWFDTSSFVQMIMTTVIIALVVVAISQLIAFTVQLYMVFSSKNIITKSIYYLTTLLHALPAVVIVFSVLALKYSTPLGIPYALGFLFFAFVLRFLGIAFLTISPAAETIPKAYLKIGSTFMTHITDQVRLIVLPYLRKYILQSGSYIYFLSLRELTIPLILLPLGMNVLSVRIWQTASEGLYVYASPAILVLLLLSLPSLVWYIRSQV